MAQNPELQRVIMLERSGEKNVLTQKDTYYNLTELHVICRSPGSSSTFPC